MNINDNELICFYLLFIYIYCYVFHVDYDEFH